jgi:thiazole biosynthesis protein thiG
VREAADRGIGEVLLNSMDADGTTDGFDIEMIRAVRQVVDVPLIASGGAGTATHFVEAARAGADAVLAASVFHYGRLTIVEVKQELAAAGFEVRGV